MKYTIVTDINQIILRHGDCLTVFLDKELDKDKSNLIQVELRVTGEGVAEVFCDAPIIKSFSEWNKA